MATIRRTASMRRPLDWAVVRRRLGRVLLYALLVSGCVATLVPFLWMILTSFKSSSEIIRIPPTLWPEKPTLANYQTIFDDPKLQLERHYLNSLIVAGSQVFMILFTSSLAGFVFAKYQFFGKGIIFGFILATMMIPGQVTMIPGYLMLAKLGLIDSLWGLIVPSATSAFGIFLTKQCIYRRIVLAQIGPALATLGILTFMGSWNAYLWPLIVITTHERRTLPIVLTWYDSVHGGRTDLTMAAGVLVVIPILFVYTFIQRWIVQGISMTGFK
jgi:multiple sugar transport system permease protein